MKLPVMDKANRPGDIPLGRSLFLSLLRPGTMRVEWGGVGGLVPPDLSCTKCGVPDSGQELGQLHVSQLSVCGEHPFSGKLGASPDLGEVLARLLQSRHHGVQTLLALAWESCPGTTTVLAFSSLRTQGDGCTPSQSSSALQALSQHTGDGARGVRVGARGVRVSHATASMGAGSDSQDRSLW